MGGAFSGAVFVFGHIGARGVCGRSCCMSLQGKTLVITGASRGIGLAIGLRAARDGANIAILAKTAEPNPKLPGTVYSAAEEIEKAGGKALPLIVDVRHEEQVADAVAKTVAAFGGIDILVNNASAISLTNTRTTEMKRFDLMHQVNTRGTFVCAQACLPYLKKARNPHILMLSPPLNLDPKWFGPHVAYTIAKYGMSLCVLGLAEEFRDDGIAVNALWPKTVIRTDALNMIEGVPFDRCRTPEIVADAACEIISAPTSQRSGEFLIDEDVLRESGVTDFDQYAIDPSKWPLPDYFLD